MVPTAVFANMAVAVCDAKRAMGMLMSDAADVARVALIVFRFFVVSFRLISRLS